jgi:predicted nucleic acid-binding protein
MNGERYLLDTNAIIALLQGNLRLVQRLQTAVWVGISIISQLEFLAFTELSESEYQAFNQFLQRVEIIGLSSEQPRLIEQIIAVRQQYRLKLPDAVIVATAMQAEAALLTGDQQLQNLPNLLTIDFSE